MTTGAGPLLRDVTLRDGLQDESPISTDDKVAIYEALVSAGVRELELTSFVRPDRVPAMADAEALAARTAGGDVPVRWALVLNPRGAERALLAGLSHLQFVVSVSDRHSLENAGRTTAQALSELDDLVSLAKADDAMVEVTLSTSFGCPFSGPVPPEQVLATVDRALESGVAGVGLADTIGTAVPTEVRFLVAGAVARAGQVPVGIHLHDTRGLAIANALAALEVGAARVDGAVGGLGGCPFAPGASGNLALEDLAYALEAMGIATGLDLDRLIDAARLACRLVGREVGSHVGRAGPRFANTPFAAGQGRVAS
jgi:hydroxymethylglutaryl-CoA lyase